MEKDQTSSGRPVPGEYADYAEVDIDLVEGDDAVAALRVLKPRTLDLFGLFDEKTATFAYSPGKWSLKQIVGHLADDERIFAYRALCIARGDTRPLPGFDENEYSAAAKFEELSLCQLLEDYAAVRDASVALFRGLDATSWVRLGTVSGYSASPRGLAFHIAGHELHHHRVVRERYLSALGHRVQLH